MVLATKFGMMSHTGRSGVDSTPANIRIAIDGSLQRLGTDYIDLYYQHRVDREHADRRHSWRPGGVGDRGQGSAHRSVRSGPETIRRANAVHPVTAVQSEYSLWTRDPEASVLPVLRKLGIGFVPYSPLGHGFLTGAIRSTDQLDISDWRTTNPRFTGDNFQHNLRIVEEVEAVAAQVGATPAQVAIAWLLAQGDDIAPIPGTKRVTRLEENVAADDVELTSAQIETLNNITPAAGDHHNEAQMQMLDRP